MTAENLKLLHYYYAKVESFSPRSYYMCSNNLHLFNYIVESDIKSENIYNMHERGFLIDHNKRTHAILSMSRKNPWLLEYNLQERDIVIKSICAYETKLPPFINFEGRAIVFESSFMLRKKSKPHWPIWKPAELLFSWVGPIWSTSKAQDE